MFCGILPWTWFSSSLLSATGSLLSGGNLIKKVLFPAEVLPIVSVLADMVHFLLGLPILAGYMLWFQHFPDPIDLLWFPLVMAIQFLFTIGLGLALSALTVHFRDVRDLLSNLVTFWFFCTPIIYPYYMENVQAYLPVLKWNPLYHLVVSYQEILFFHGPFGHQRSLFIMGGVSLVTFAVGYWLFDRLRDSFAEAI